MFANPLELMAVGAALPLLACIIARCGDGEVCDLKYAEVFSARKPGVTTAKSWAAKLESAGYIQRQPLGPQGVRIRLSAEKFACPPVNKADVDREHLLVVIAALKTTVDAALDGAAGQVAGARGVQT